MQFAQVWAFRDRQAIRMDMYSNAAEALEAAGLREARSERPERQPFSISSIR